MNHMAIRIVGAILSENGMELQMKDIGEFVSRPTCRQEWRGARNHHWLWDDRDGELNEKGFQRDCLIDGRRRLLNLMHVNLLFRNYLAIQKCLNGESSGPIKGHIREEADVVCVALRLYPKLRWS